LLSGGWVNFAAQLPLELAPAKVGILSVVALDGTEKIYNGSNGAEMEGFFKNTNNRARLPFLNQANINPYLVPIGRAEIDLYATRGYELKQTEGWSQN